MLPNPAGVRKHKWLGVLGNRIYDPNLWHINRYSASVACFVGIFSAMLPIPGQIFVAAFAAMLLRCNLPLSITLIWVTNPITIPPIFYLAYRLGALLMDIPAQIDGFTLSWEWLSQSMDSIWQPLLLGSLVMAVCLGALGYFVMNMVWRAWVTLRWHRRQQQRLRRDLTPDEE